jgi:hypothetical protein
VKVIFKLTKQQHTALLLAATKGGCPNTHQRVLLRLEENRLVVTHVYEAGTSRSWITKGGELALRAKPRNSVWWPSLPDLENSHMVRKLVKCKGCNTLDLNLPKIEGVSMHAACIVMHHGWQALADLPNAELNKMMVQDFGHLGLTIVDLQEVLGWKPPI